MTEITDGLAPDLCIQPLHDANQQAASLLNWQQQYDQLSDGLYQGKIIERRFSHLHVFREDSNRVLRQACQVKAGGLWIGLSAQDQPLHLNHATMSTNHLLMRPGGIDFELITPEHFSIYGLVLDNHLLQAILENADYDAKDIEVLEQVKSAKLATTLRHYLAILLTNTPSNWSCHTHEILIKDFITGLLTQTPGRQRPMTPHRRQVIMANIRQQLDTMDTTKPITISELCESTHVSRRTLQYTFETCCGVSPQQFIHTSRLNQVRRALQNRSERQTVYEIAFRFGFYHMGQFAMSYRRLFGERPSETKIMASDI